MKKKERRKRKSEEKERRRREKKQWLQWRIQVRHPPPPAPLIFRPNLGPKGQKKIAIRSIILSLTSLLESVYEII